MIQMLQTYTASLQSRFPSFGVDPLAHSKRINESVRIETGSPIANVQWYEDDENLVTTFTITEAIPDGISADNHFSLITQDLQRYKVGKFLLGEIVIDD